MYNKEIYNGNKRVKYMRFIQISCKHVLGADKLKLKHRIYVSSVTCILSVNRLEEQCDVKKSSNRTPRGK